MTILDLSSGGLTAELPVAEASATLVAPVNGADSNTIRSLLIPVACWRLEDARFAFDSSFPVPEAAEELRLLAALMRTHPGAPVSLFGHADPVGKDVYNKTLAGRRAMAIFAMATRNVAMWETLFNQPFGGDVWGEPVLALIAADLGIAAGTPRPPRAQLFRSYMDKHCRDEKDQQFVLTAKDFLAGGADPGGKGDFQGCGEFNPILRFSRAEEADFAKPERKGERDKANAPNRRVTALLFRPDSRVSPDRWPCPRATEGPDGCRKRFFANAEARRTPTEERRENSRTRDTFVCRFYDRITRDSPCERVAKRTVFNYGLELRDNLPWTDKAIVLVTSEDNRQNLRFTMAQGLASGTHRVFVLTDIRPGIRYKGNVRDGDSVLELFDFCELFPVAAPDDPLDVLPLSEPAPDSPLPPVVPQPDPRFSGPIEPVDFEAVNDAASPIAPAARR